MKGIKPRATKESLHEKKKPKVMPNIKAKADSNIKPTDSVPAPFIFYTSEANTVVKIPDELSL